MTAQITVRPADVLAEGAWDMSSSCLRWSPHDYAGRAEFDPFPAYAHTVADVQDAVDKAMDVVMPIWQVTCYVANREACARTNGFSNVYEPRRTVGDTRVTDEPQGVIVLSAKRIPPHPAMTRYLVAHEYGHNVEWMLNRARGAKNIHTDDLVTEYAKLRGIPGNVHHGSGGCWHSSVTEIFACDFRILVLESETEFWPHPGFDRPETVGGLDRWWQAELERLDETRTAAEADRSAYLECE